MDSLEDYNIPGVIARTFDKGLEHLAGAVLVGTILAIGSVGWIVDYFYLPKNDF